MRIAVLVKQIPAPVEFRMQDGRLVRDGVPLEVNAYCRRANAKAVELAGSDGEVVVFTMGPPAAADALREMIACGADRGVHLCDPAFAGSDTLATAVALAAAIRREWPFDLVLAGLNSLDSDTGQVPVEVAELLGLPFAAGVRDLEVVGGSFTARLETDDGFCTVEGDLPAALSTAERLCAPSKAPPEVFAEVADDRIVRLSAADLDVPAEQLGAPGSPTSVGPIRVLTATRRALRAASVAHAIDLLEEFGAFSDPPESDDSGDASRASAALLAASTDWAQAAAGERSVWCFFTEPDVGAELLGEASELAAWISGTVTAVTTGANGASSAELGAAGADRLLVIESASEPSEQADALAAAAARRAPWALLVEGTRSGRVVASIVAARCGWGSPAMRSGWKSAPTAAWWRGSPRSAVASRCRSCRARRSRWPRSGPAFSRCGRPGLTPPTPKSSCSRRRPPPGSAHRSGARRRRHRRAAPGPDGGGRRRGRRPRRLSGDRRAAGRARRRRAGCHPQGHRRGLGDRGRQIGVTGQPLAPRLLVAVGSSGRFNHTVGIRNAGVLMAVNSNPDAEIFDQVDIGLVGEWQTVVPALTAELEARGVADRMRQQEPAATAGIVV